MERYEIFDDNKFTPKERKYFKLELENTVEIDQKEMRRRCYTLAAKTQNIWWEILADRQSW